MKVFIIHCSATTNLASSTSTQNRNARGEIFGIEDIKINTRRECQLLHKTQPRPCFTKKFFYFIRVSCMCFPVRFGNNVHNEDKRSITVLARRNDLALAGAEHKKWRRGSRNVGDYKTRIRQKATIKNKNTERKKSI
jgi:hypothetical protein